MIFVCDFENLYHFRFSLSFVLPSSILQVPCRTGVPDLCAELQPKSWWDHDWPLLLPSLAPVSLPLLPQTSLLPFLKLCSPPPLCLSFPGLLLTEGSSTVAGKGWSGSACQHQTEDRSHKRTSKGGKRERDWEEIYQREPQRKCEKKQQSRCHAGKTEVSSARKAPLADL